MSVGEVLAEYDTDFHAWAVEQATLLREYRLGALDVDHIAEELEALAARDGYERDFVAWTAEQARLPRECFPPTCQWTIEQVLDDGFWPGPDAPGP